VLSVERPDVDPEAAIDLMFGPAMYQMVAGHAPQDDTAADAIVDAAMRGFDEFRRARRPGTRRRGSRRGRRRSPFRGPRNRHPPRGR
jgi:hypothetical protein